MALLLVVTAASLRLRRSRPPAQGCGRQTATLGPHPTKPFNPNGVAPHTPFSHPSRPEPLCGSIVTPHIPRVGLIPFGRPWAGGRKPFGLGGRPPFRHLPRGGWGLGAAGVVGTDELVSCGSMSIAFAAVELCSGASDLGQDVLGLGRPNGGLRFLVVLEKLLPQRGDQLR